MLSLLASSSGRSIFNIFVFNWLSCSWVYRFFYNFSYLLTVFHLCPFSNSFLLTILNYSWLLYWFSHSTTHTSKAARLERRWKAITITHHVHVHSHAHVTKASSKEIIIIIESHSHRLLHKHTTLVLFWTSVSHYSTSESTITEKIIIVIKKVWKGITTTKKVFEYFISWLHIKMIISSITKAKVMIEPTTTTTTMCSTIHNIISTISVEIFSFFLIRQNLICKRDLFKYLFSFFLIIGVFIRMIF